ncbi:MAG: flagellar protein FlgN [Chitinispirillia bacterium]|nr:flagellar protein FlgN [Chitinispirillia bacterium]
MDKTALFNELIELLTHENDTHQNLITIANEINKSARAKNIDELQRKCNAYDEQICVLERAEDRRMELCTRISDILNNAAPSGRLLSLIEHCEPAQKKRLQEIKAVLTNRLNELKAVNTSNTVLFKEALGDISASVDMIKESARPKSGYRYKGDVKPVGTNLTMFNQVI